MRQNLQALIPIEKHRLPLKNAWSHSFSHSVPVWQRNLFAITEYALIEHRRLYQLSRQKIHIALILLYHVRHFKTEGEPQPVIQQPYNLRFFPAQLVFCLAD